MQVFEGPRHWGVSNMNMRALCLEEAHRLVVQMSMWPRAVGYVTPGQVT